MRHVILALLLAALAAGSETPPPVATWTDIVAWKRNEGRAAPFMVYVGSLENRLGRALASGRVPLHGLRLGNLQGGRAELNPVTDAPVPGHELMRLFGCNAGTVLFFSDLGLPLGEITLPQPIHADDLDLIELYARYLGTGQNKSLTILEYARALGKESLITGMYARAKGTNPLIGRDIVGTEPVLIARNARTGDTIDPWTESGVFYVYTCNPMGRVTMAFLHEIWNAYGHLGVKITLVCPAGMEPSSLALPDDFKAVLANADRAAIRTQGPSPHVIFTANNGQQRKGLLLRGFQPAEGMSMMLRIPPNKTRLNRDIAVGEVDDDEAPAGAGLLDGAEGAKK